jgi:tetratricopeptide (TPR) repeat protein
MAYMETHCGVSIMPKTIQLLCLCFLFLQTLSWGQQGVPEEALRYMARGEAAVESAQSSGDFKSAIAEFEKACALAPNWPNPFFNLGIVQENTGDFEGAIKNLKRYLELAPNANDAAEVRTKIYKLEYKKERSNIAGIWKVDQNESKAECDPPGFLYGKGHILSSVFMIDDLKIDIKQNPSGLEARALSSQTRFRGDLPDGRFVPIQREGDTIKIFNLPMNTCNTSARADMCPWTARLILKQTAADVLEGTIEVSGMVEKITRYTPQLTHQTAALRGSGKLLLRKAAQ